MYRKIEEELKAWKNNYKMSLMLVGQDKQVKLIYYKSFV